MAEPDDMLMFQLGFHPGVKKKVDNLLFMAGLTDHGDLVCRALALYEHLLMQEFVGGEVYVELEGERFPVGPIADDVPKF